ncbi:MULTISPECIES: ribbon-helix-helix domain-containing protein [Bacilli]|uniref:ribbon-helix-helix domain-containing protein n=1 Tax=Bacilli TaxID=91061 RepID=UPI002D80F1CD|nr:protein repA [Carnobacterium maltaromaticum]
MVEKKKVTLSLPVETNDKLEELAKKYGMTKSGLINFLVNQASEKGTIYGQ